jgi:hypothetical protein
MVGTEWLRHLVAAATLLEVPGGRVERPEEGLPLGNGV